MDRRNTNRDYARRSGTARPAATGNARQRPQPVRAAGETRYDGRFGSSADAGRQRPTGSYRSQPSGSYRSRMDYGSRPAGGSRPAAGGSGDSYTRRPSPETVEKKQPKQARKKPGIGAIIAVVAVLALAALIAVVLGSRGTVHQLPTVERGNAILTEDL